MILIFLQRKILLYGPSRPLKYIYNDNDCSDSRYLESNSYMKINNFPSFWKRSWNNGDVEASLRRFTPTQIIQRLTLLSIQLGSILYRCFTPKNFNPSGLRLTKVSYPAHMHLSGKNERFLGVSRIIFSSCLVRLYNCILPTRISPTCASRCNTR